MKNTEPVFFNRDLSWIDFNARVLEEALRDDLPVLERMKFLSIVSSNFDEFFMVRIAAIKRAMRKGESNDPSGLRCEEQLLQASNKIRSIVKRQYECLSKDVIPALAKAGLPLVHSSAYTTQQQQYLETIFLREVFPTLTPLRVEDDEELPSIGNLRLHSAFLLERLEKDTLNGWDAGTESIAIVQIPSSLERIIWLPNETEATQAWTLLDDVVLNWGHTLFPGYKVKEALMFKVTRDADFGVDEDRGDDFLEAMEEVLVGREYSRAVRMSYSSGSPLLRQELAKRLGLEDLDCYEMPGPIDLRTLYDITRIKKFDHLREAPWKSYWPVELPEEEPFWDTIRRGDILLHFPYHSFEPVIRFFNDAASDPQVLSIKTTLYRTSGNSPIIKALERAARNGKHVTALVELKARFDEEQNISWANRLEDAGVIVVYGIARLKVHAKACLVVRRESDGIQRYLHLSTGNYNDRSARLYSDLCLFTAQDDFAYDANLFFNMITGYSIVQNMRRLILAPTAAKYRLIELIQREADRSSLESPGRIIAKMNSLADTDVIRALYKASQAGVQIDLNVRGICMLVPGIKGLSEHIRVISIVDRYLEHSRVFYFLNGGAEELYLSSADWMPRNLERRVELMFPIQQEKLRAEILGILDIYFKDNCRVRELDSQGHWTLRSSASQEEFRAQEQLYLKTKRHYETAKNAPEQEFVVRRKNPAETIQQDEYKDIH